VSFDLCETDVAIGQLLGHDQCREARIQNLHAVAFTAPSATTINIVSRSACLNIETCRKNTTSYEHFQRIRVRRDVIYHLY